MKLLFLGENNQKAFDRIEELFRKRGHSVHSLPYSKNDSFQNFQELRDMLVAYDGVVTDSSGLTPLTEFHLAYALQADKQVLLTHYNKDNLNNSITKSKSKKMYIKSYEDKLELEDAIDQFIHILESNLDAKLFMIIPPDVNRYLDWVASHTDKSKSDVVRSAVLNVAEKDQDYQKFLKNFEK